MIVHEFGMDPAEAALALLGIAGALGGLALLFARGVLRAQRRRRQEEWLMRERLALWRQRADRAAAGAADLAAAARREHPAG